MSVTIAKLAKRFSTVAAAAALAAVTFAVPVTARAADHGDAPNVASDAGMDLADVYFFLNPNDNTKAVLIMTFRGFITPGEMVNFSVFDHLARYRFNIENTGDVTPDQFIDITFTQRTISGSTPQVATVKYGNTTFKANSTVLSLAATAREPVITTHGPSGIRFFASAMDDPFFFDIPGFNRFVASVRAGAPDATLLQRGRDTFAGYSVMCIALEIPVARLKGAGDTVGVYAEIDRRTQSLTNKGFAKGTGAFRQGDRMGNPAVNVALIPFDRKNEYNAATPKDDARGRFAPDIVATLTALGASEAAINTLAGVAVTNGDYLRLNTAVANTGSGGGDNAGAGFPNGRRLKDDVIDILLTIIAGTPLGDNVNGNEKPLRDDFPFLAAPHQPREPGTIDDQTRN